MSLGQWTWKVQFSIVLYVWKWERFTKDYIVTQTTCMCKGIKSKKTLLLALLRPSRPWIWGHRNKWHCSIHLLLAWRWQLGSGRALVTPSHILAIVAEIARELMGKHLLLIQARIGLGHKSITIPMGERSKQRNKCDSEVCLSYQASWGGTVNAQNLVQGFASSKI